MPLYEYVCKECEHNFEVLQRIGEGAEGVTCPECGAGKLEKQFSTFAGTVSGGSASSMGGGGGGSACGSGGFT